MKTLILLRHAKSSWSDPFLDDFDRPLNKRGRLNAPEMGKRLRMINMIPDTVIASPAARAAATAIHACESMGYPKEEIIWERDLYHASASTIWHIIRQYASGDKVMVVSHNPGLNSIAYQMGLSVGNIPTAGILSVNFSVKDWSKVGPEVARLDFFDFPKNKGKVIRQL
ncbi:SixA phosphatase family protein [Marinigracilibium pacificum]|uniref:Histidine phosphatase family protein n=1 Tax=Marinigracilibium pacificum TaxID=2729599 RepID=A0A848J2A2_9BACT|nr:histidine phosphatase family protein [Marinigracilibium pacificum]NMM49635.1 histidine phosphatase family protein [Marinigracilibium pacificum]